MFCSVSSDQTPPTRVRRLVAPHDVFQGRRPVYVRLTYMHMCARR